MTKSNKTLFGVIFLVLGIGLGVWAYQMSDSLESQINELVSGSPTDQVMWLTIASALCGVIGLIMLFKK